jgi:hypothetical protein
VKRLRQLVNDGDRIPLGIDRERSMKLCFCERS